MTEYTQEEVDKIAKTAQEEAQFKAEMRGGINTVLETIKRIEHSLKDKLDASRFVNEMKSWEIRFGAYEKKLEEFERWKDNDLPTVYISKIEHEPFDEFFTSIKRWMLGVFLLMVTVTLSAIIMLGIIVSKNGFTAIGL